MVNVRLDIAIENGLFDLKSEGPLSRFIHYVQQINRKSNKESSEPTSNLSKDNKTDEPDDILENLKDAKNNFSNRKLPEAEQCLSNAKRKLAKKLNSAPFWWKMESLYAGYIWIYLASILAIIFFIFFSGIDLLHRLHVTDPAINAATWGVIGGVLRAMWFLKSKMDSRTYRNSYNTYFISIPFLGGILGGLIYLILFGGVLALTGGNINALTHPGTANQGGTDLGTANQTLTKDNINTSKLNQGGTDLGTANQTLTKDNINTSKLNQGGTDNQTKPLINPLTIIPFAALAGYNWEWAINLFNKLGDFLMDNDNHERRSVLDRKREF